MINSKKILYSKGNNDECLAPDSGVKPIIKYIPMKRIIGILMILCLALSVTGCAELVSTEKKEVKVTIVSSYHRSIFVKPARRAVYRITVEHEGKRYDIDDRATYNKYNNKIGEAVTATFNVFKYDNGTELMQLTSLGDSYKR